MIWTWICFFCCLEEEERKRGKKRALEKKSLALSSLQLFSYLVVDLRSGRALLLRKLVADAVNHEADVALIDEVRRARNIIEVGRRSRPVLDLLRMADKPRRDVIVLGEPLDFRQHLRHVLGLGDVAGPLVVELVVRVDDEASDAVAGGSGKKRLPRSNE